MRDKLDDSVMGLRRNTEDTFTARYPKSVILASVGLVLLVESTVMLTAAGATNVWIVEEGTGRMYEVYEQYYGFYAYCQRILSSEAGADFMKYKCGNRLEYLIRDIPKYSTYEEKLKDRRFNARTWELACLALLASSIALNVFVLLFLLFSGCCRCWRFYLDFATPWASVATICSAVALGLFSHQLGTRMRRDDPGLGTMTPDAVALGWSYWLALTGASLQFLATLLLGCGALLRRKCDS